MRNHLQSVSNISLEYSTSSGLNIKVLDSDSGYYIFRFWSRNMDFHKFAIAGELLVLIACNQYQANP